MSLKTILKPWWLSTFFNLLIFALIINDSPLPKKDLLLLAVLFSGATLITIQCLFWTHKNIHKTALLIPAGIILAGLQTFAIVFSLAMVWRYGHMPSPSEVSFLFEYPVYSYALFTERAGMVGFCFVSMTFILFFYAWLSREESSNRDTKGKKYWASAVFLVIVGATNQETLLPPSVEIHSVNLIYRMIENRLIEDSSGEQFVLNRISLPNLEQWNNSIDRPNILLFRMEEVSKDKFGLYAEAAHPTTPFLTGLQATSPDTFFLYEHHISNAGATDTSTTLLYTGLRSDRKGREFGQYPLIWDYANSAGYETAMFIPFHITWGGLKHKWAGNGGVPELNILIDALVSNRRILYDNSISDDDIANLAID